jgi:hypothetical protein
MTYTPPDFHVSRPIGRGTSHPSDVRRLRTALRRTGHGSFPRNAEARMTPGLADALRRFQSDFGLEADAVIDPEGPTERTLSMAIASLDSGGDRALSDMRKTFARRAEAGLVFRPDPENVNGGLWRDTDGNMLADDEADAAAERQPVQLAYMRKREIYRRRGDDILEGGGGASGTNRGGPTLDSRIGEWFGNLFRGGKPQVPANDNQRTKVPADDFNREELIPPPIPGLQVPPSPVKPPAVPTTTKGRPAEERKPTITVFPVPEFRDMSIEVFPDQSNIIEKWFILENSRGLPHLQQKDLQYIIDGLYRRLMRYGLVKVYEHIGGGYTATDSVERPPGDYVTEKVLKNGTQNKGSRRPDYSFTIGGIRYDINVVDLLADGVTMTARERRAFEAIIAIKEEWKNNGGTRTFGKSKNMTWEEYTAEVDRLLDILVEEIVKRHRREIGN